MADAEAATTPGASAHGIITHKLGPLPVWAWVVIAGGVAFLIVHRRAASGGTASGGGASSPAAAGGGTSMTPAQAQAVGQMSQFQSGIDMLNTQLAQNMNAQASLGNTVGNLGNAISGIPQAVATAVTGAVKASPPVVTTPAAPAAQLAPPSPNSTPGGVYVKDGGYYLNAWDFYGPGAGVGLNEVLKQGGVPFNSQSFNDVLKWNAGASGGQPFYKAGQPIYLGSVALGKGH